MRNNNTVTPVDVTNDAQMVECRLRQPKIEYPADKFKHEQQRPRCKRRFYPQQTSETKAFIDKVLAEGSPSQRDVIIKHFAKIPIEKLNMQR